MLTNVNYILRQLATSENAEVNKMVKLSGFCAARGRKKNKRFETKFGVQA